MKKAVLLLLVTIIMVLAIGCQKSKADDISDYSFKQAKQFVAVTEKFLDGDIDLETAKEKLNDLNRHFLYGEAEKGEDSVSFSLIGSSEVLILNDLKDADNYDDEAIKKIKDELSDIEEQIYK